MTLIAPIPAKLRRIDLVVKPYMVSSNWIAFWQLANTLVPLLACSILLVFYANSLNLYSVISVPLLLVLIVLFLGRSFSLMHDCGHNSLFASSSLNRLAAFVLSIVHAMPHYPWSKGHAFHHKHNGNWSQYRGPSALITLKEYSSKSPASKFLYRLLRNPIILIPGGFYYLILKPRIALVLAGLEFIGCSINYCRGRVFGGRDVGIAQFFSEYSSKFFYSRGEVFDTLANSICVVFAWWWIGGLIGHWHFWILYSIIMSLSAALVIAVFFVQHNFEGSYASGQEGWSYFRGAIEGSSYLRLPKILNWFTADIAYHHIHHLSERIPNYRLRDCHEANEHLLGSVYSLYLRQVVECFSLILWDDEACELVPARG